MATEPLNLPTFRSTLEQNPQYAAALNPVTAWRYRRGDFPKALAWLLKYPALLRALADDAERQQAATDSPTA